MIPTEVLTKLKELYELKDAHIRILSVLNEQSLTADELCRETYIKKGIIYSLLNELIEYELIDKTFTVPHKYITKGIEGLSNFVDHNFNNLIKNQLNIISHLYHKKQETMIQPIIDIKNLISTFTKAINKSKYCRINERTSAVPLFFFNCLNKDTIKELLPISKQVLYNISEKDYIDLMQNLREKHNSNEFRYILHISGVSNYLRNVRKLLGDKNLRDIIKNIITYISENKIKVRISNRDNPYYIFIGDTELIISIISGKKLNGILTKNQEFIEFYKDFYDNEFAESEKLVDYLNRVIDNPEVLRNVT
jgi:sugar-specific transcriptional regulator TrmB